MTQSSDNRYNVFLNKEYLYVLKDNNIKARDIWLINLNYILHNVLRIIR